ncbi:MAG: signal recognition particle-docking protein FtsY [Legionellaceae bacterium]|nr:signal recognition particle-docking protein FtsY [Legionellaceae bacterium]
MIKWLKKIHNSSDTQAELMEATQEHDSSIPQDRTIDVQHDGVFARIKRGLSKTRNQLGAGIGRLLLGKKEIDAALLDELEILLLSADLGFDMTTKILHELSDDLKRNQLGDGDAVFTQLKKRLQLTLSVNAKPLLLSSDSEFPFVILMIGVNGAGKTTTIGKLAKQYQQQGKKVMLAAGDTFRAAAVEQLQVWGERNQIPVIAQHTGADSASVIFDAFQAAKSRGIDVLIADTAGRLHTQHNLMDELKKVKRVLQKIDPSAPHETMLVLDAGIGQNALNQARQFNNSIGLTGITMTKLDGTAKGGILFAIANELGIPFRYIGIGEGIDDLRPFDAPQFVDAIFYDDHI